MLSAIIRERTMSCCSLAIQTSTARELCNVARGWAGSCVITIKKRREMAGKSWMSPVRLAGAVRLRNDKLIFVANSEGVYRLTSPARLGGRAEVGYDNIA